MTIDNRYYTIESMKKYYQEVVESIINNDLVKATKYVSPKLVVRGTRTRYGGKFLRGNIEITLTIGKPNYAEREFIKLLKKAKEPFPVKLIQVKHYQPKQSNLKNDQCIMLGKRKCPQHSNRR